MRHTQSSTAPRAAVTHPAWDDPNLASPIAVWLSYASTVLAAIGVAALASLAYRFLG